MFKTIGILAHVDAGKTTFSEQLLFHTNSIRTRGRVDHQDAFLDNHEIERNRGITIFAEQGNFTYNGSTYTIIDTPGHVDFSPEMERAIQVMDYAIVLISAADGVEGHTETVWQLLQKHRIPTFFFLNKMDREGTDLPGILNEMRMSFSTELMDVSQLKEGALSDELIEFIAERDEELLERYMEGDYDEDAWRSAIRRMIQELQVFPYGCGSALKDIGINEFLDAFDRLTVTDYCKESDLAARVYKIRHDENGNRVTFLKLMSGTLRVRHEIHTGTTVEKVTQLRRYNGKKYTTVDHAVAGELIAVTGLAEAAIGDGIGALPGGAAYDLIPTLRSSVRFDSSIPLKDMLHAFRTLDAEDPSLQVVWDEHVQEVHVHVMGVIQLEVLKQVVRDRFGYDIEFGQPTILYKETISAPVNGYGHFEPLKHYAEVHLRIEPAERGAGITFANECHANDLSIGNQNLIKHHIFEQDHHGLLTGSALTDVKITLLTGRGHNEHTSGGDFREATFRALRQGLEKTDNVLLEPYYDVKVKIDMDHIGRVLSDIQQAHGTFDPPETIGEKTVITGRVPVATFMEYSTIFASFTNGKGAMTLRFSGYDVCHNPEEVIERIGYNKDADPEYTSTSIFCAKGKGYAVPWNEAEEAMHLL
ncbi:translation factor GTPase family protein [Sporosarcina sp. Te-1]|uniref:elongation factor G n=1 Tax=Sporosarcina sp. Te-1 TaxID=2818390 RepID=UPI001A9F6092|nr:TetM/TetW/TetO/TetS family tetracycline resistance ribosomal protection protein [Sporosarcina sp. Te-1]QTD40036.1 TetM/TetW/TetO/TetS family tetracycline resistance ribosomal protection protein [Sporosarcina sp. Te-1]